MLKETNQQAGTSPFSIKNPFSQIEHGGKSKAIWPLLLVLTIAIGERLFNLDLIGPFLDELAHIKSGALRYSFNPLIDLEHGIKVFGYVAIFPPAQWARYPLEASRLYLGFFGVLTTLGVYLTTLKLKDRSAALVAGLIWAAMPYIVYHDRLAIFDPFVSFFIIWSVFFLVASLEDLSLFKSFASGLFLGLASITKITGVGAGLWLILLALTIINLSTFKRHLKPFTFLIAGFALPLMIVSLFLISRLAGFIDIVKNVMSSGSGNNIGMAENIIKRFDLLLDWFTTYNSPAFSFFCLITLSLAFYRPTKIKIGLALFFIISAGAHILLINNWYPRYFLPVMLPVTVLCGVVGSEYIGRVKSSWHQSGFAKWISLAIGGILALCILATIPGWARTSWYLQTDPKLAAIPEKDRWQHFYGWPSGYGVREIASYLEEAADGTKETIALFSGVRRAGIMKLPLIIHGADNIKFTIFNETSRLSDAIISSLLAKPAEKKLIIEETDHLFGSKGHFSQYYSIFPHPELAFEYKDKNVDRTSAILELGSTDPWAFFDANYQIDRDLGNRTFYWMAENDVHLKVVSLEDGIFIINIDVYRGSDNINLPTSILLSTGDGYSARTIIYQDGSARLSFPVKKGLNLLTIHSLEKKSMNQIHILKPASMSNEVGSYVNDPTSLFGKSLATFRGKTANGRLMASPYHTWLEGEYCVRFHVRAGNVGDGAIASLIVSADSGKKNISKKTLSEKDFMEQKGWRVFALPVSVPSQGLKKVGISIEYHGAADFFIDEALIGAMEQEGSSCDAKRLPTRIFIKDVTFKKISKQ